MAAGMDLVVVNLQFYLMQSYPCCILLPFSNMTLVSLILNQPTSNIEGWTEYNVYGKREHFQFALVISPSAIKD